MTLPTFLQSQIWPIAFCVGGAAMLAPTLAFATRYVEGTREQITGFLQCSLIVGGTLALILLISDYCPFPGGLFHEGRPLFLGGWMIAAGVCILLVFFVCIATATSEEDEQDKQAGLMCMCGVLVLLAWLVPFQTRFGLLLFPIATHALRTTLLPLCGPIGFSILTTSWSVVIYLILTKCDDLWDVLPLLLLAVFSFSWTVHGIANSLSFPDATIRYSKLPPAQALAVAPTFRHTSDWTIIEEAFRQSKDAGFREAGLRALTQSAENREGKSGLTAVQAVIAAGKQIVDERHRSYVLRVSADAALRLGQEELPRECRLEALSTAVTAAKGIRDEAHRSYVLQAVASDAGELGRHEGSTALQTVIAAAKQIWDEERRNEVLRACRKAAIELEVDPKDVGLEQN